MKSLKKYLVALPLGILGGFVLGWIYLSIFPRNPGVAFESVGEALHILGNFIIGGAIVAVVIAMCWEHIKGLFKRNGVKHRYSRKLPRMRFLGALLITLAVLGVVIARQWPQSPLPGTPGQIISFSGKVTDFNDAEAEITVKPRLHTAVRIQTPQGFNLCPVGEVIFWPNDPVTYPSYAIIGQTVEVRGELQSDGTVSICEEDEYIRKIR